jgi:ABC-type multidrug transport system ATPase subunit
LHELRHDSLLPNLSVYETLNFAARLRLPSSISKKELEERVESTLSVLGLKDVRNSRIGGESVRGISGGERRRVSVGVQMLSNPSILILDGI